MAKGTVKGTVRAKTPAPPLKALRLLTLRRFARLSPHAPHFSPELLEMLGLGAALGFLGGLFGIGGGIIVIPLLVLGFGLDQAVAQGTALVMMVPNLLICWWRYHQRHPVALVRWLSAPKRKRHGAGRRGAGASCRLTLFP